MLSRRVQLSLVGVALGPLEVRKWRGSQLRNDQFTLAGVAFREAFAATGPCREAEQEHQQFVHEFARSVAGGTNRRKKIACRLVGPRFRCQECSHRSSRSEEHTSE